jgi:glycerol-3-phosphate dehydrogenase subunit C
MKHQLDWSAYKNSGQGDAYADIPTEGGDFARAVAVCIGDKLCESKPKGVMCPSFRLSDDPAQSTGGRVKVLKAALNGELGGDPFTHPALLDALDLCVACKGCKRECANQVDMASIKFEVLAQRNARTGVPLRSRLFAELPRLLQWRRPLAALIAWRNASPLLARLGERLLGIAAARPLPLPTTQPFTVAAMPADSTVLAPTTDTTTESDERRVALLVDTYSGNFEPEIADAALTVLRAGGYRVDILSPAPDDAESRPLCCGRSYLSAGMVDAARREARRMIAAVRPALAAGIPVVGLEPSCLATLRDEYLKLGLGEDAVRLSRQSFLLEEFLAREHDRKRLHLDLKPLPAGPRTLVHGHCHQKTFGAMKSMRKVLRLIPQFEFEFIDASCCGMAGTFGMEAEHQEASCGMANLDLVPALAAAPESPVLANGFSCRQQIRDCADRQPRHLALLLRDALA